MIAVVQLLSCVQLFATSCTATRQAFLSFVISLTLLKFMSIELVMPSNHLVLCCPLVFLPSNSASIRVFSNELAFHFVALLSPSPPAPRASVSQLYHERWD